MKYILSIVIFIVITSLSLFVGWISGWNFTRSPEAGLWAMITLVFSLYMASYPIIFYKS